MKIDPASGAFMLNRFLFIALLGLSVTSAYAEEAASQSTPATSSAAKPAGAAASPVQDMQPIAIGDFWSYDLTDNISGELKQRRTARITEITPKSITARIERAGDSRVGIIVYDTAWDVIKSGPQRFSPNDGSGIQQPLEIGKSWKIRSDRIDSTGAIWKKIGESRVVGKESITTKAGQFDAFVIETKFSAQNTKDRARKTEGVVRMWYSPAIDHWVKRSIVFRVNGHVLQNYAVELTAYGRKKT